jgi:hypothetical protein
MNKGMIDAIAFAFVGFALIAVLYQVITKGGFRGAMFGARVTQTIGEIDFGPGSGSPTLRVHRLAEDGDRHVVGLEVFSAALGSVAIRGIPMTREEARNLSRLLEVAAAA